VPWSGEGGLILDVDHRERLGVSLPRSYRVLRGCERGHAYFRLPAGIDPRTVPATAPFGEVRVEGAARHVVGPYSRHATGDIYLPHGDTINVLPLDVLQQLLPVKPTPELGNGHGYHLPEPGYAGSRYEAIRDYSASRYKRGLSREEIWRGVVDVLSPRFAEPLSEPELKERFDRALKDASRRLGEPLPDPVDARTLPDVTARPYGPFERSPTCRPPTRSTSSPTASSRAAASCWSTPSRGLARRRSSTSSPARWPPGDRSSGGSRSTAPGARWWYRASCRCPRWPRTPSNWWRRATTSKSSLHTDDRAALAGRSRALRALVRAWDTEVLALDPWYRLFAGESSDKAEQVGVVFDVCDELLEEGLVQAVIVVHHANVTGLRTAGSWLFEGWPSTIIKLEQVAGVANQRIATFEKVRAPSSSLLGERIQIALGEQGYLPIMAGPPAVGAGPALAAIVVREAGGQLHRSELLDRLMARGHVKLRAANKYLGEAVQAGLLKRVPDGARKVYQAVEQVAP
jgi:hypothetical protein